MPGVPGAIGGPASLPPGVTAPTGPPAIETNYYYRAGLTPGEWPAKPLVSDHDALHNERANVLFTDGHARRLPLGEWRATGLKPIDEMWAPAMPGMGGMGMPGPPGGMGAP